MAGINNIANLTKIGADYRGRPHIFWGVLSVMMLLIGGACTAPAEVKFTDVDPSNWRMPATISVVNGEMEGLHDLNLLIRSNDHLNGDSLSIIVTIHTPDSLRYEEVLSIPAPRTKAPAARAQQSAIPYLQKIDFRSCGEYKITLTPKTPIRGVEAVGIQIEKSI